MPHPFNNLYHDDMLEMEVIMEELNIKIHLLKEELKDCKSKLRRAGIYGTIGGAVITTIVAVLLQKR